MSRHFRYALKFLGIRIDVFEVFDLELFLHIISWIIFKNYLAKTAFISILERKKPAKWAETD